VWKRAAYDLYQYRRIWKRAAVESVENMADVDMSAEATEKGWRTGVLPVKK
jgi:hypothetical protein